MALLEVNDLVIEYRNDNLWIPAVNGVSFTVDQGEFVGVAGESGCGKSTLVHGILGLLTNSARVASGTVRLDGVDLLALPEDDWQRLRWRQLSVVLQSGMNSLNPVLKIRQQFNDMYKAHKVSPGKQFLTPEQLVEMVGVPVDRLASYPHQLSGGQRQRIAIALALALHPKLVIMDEPTTALDVVVQREIFDVLQTIRAERDFSVILVTHDLTLLLERASKVLVMYSGKIVEQGLARSLRTKPRHPYTEALMRAFPAIGGQRGVFLTIEGSPPSIWDVPEGCAFHPRCHYQTDVCRIKTPNSVPVDGGVVSCHHVLPILEEIIK